MRRVAHRTRLYSSSVVLTAAAMALAACSSTGSTAGSSGSTSSGANVSGSAFQAQHKGGTLTMLANGGGGTLDPQINYTNTFWQLYQNTYDGLLKFRRGVSGAASEEVVPDLATAMPKVTNSRKTYTFTLRKGIKFSNGSPVTVDDVLATFQRLFKVSSPTAGSWYAQIVGADACLKTPATCTLKGGVVVNPKTNEVQFNLTSPNPEFKYQLAVPFTVILPKSAPAKDAGDTPIPTTGPYKFVSYDPSSELVMVRNPYFHEWSHAAQPQGYPDKMIYKFTLDAEAEVSAVENGSADWMFDPPPADRLNEIGTKYPKQVHINPQLAFWYVPMNVNIPPFNNVKARQAVNWAIDRAAVVSLYGGTKVGSPVCTILPPNFPGHADSCQYTKGGGTTWKAPDVAKAKKLVEESGTKGQQVTIVSQSDSVNKSIGEYLQSVLTEIGYKASLKTLSENIEFTYIQNTKHKVQISLTQWYEDYPAASDFLNVLLGCSDFHPGSDSSVNIAGFCDKSIDAKMQTAEALMGTNPDAGNKMWGQIDQDIMKLAPVAPLFTPNLVDFVSSRVGNYVYSNVFFMNQDQLWVK
ncbi:ABC transporter substrate-binding protein [Leekyejoonella antrihumi]|uniref:ABC transporter substrate-binding protein n=2 Tax=Leekyejoonella antrihumi TaxID=1660198 RepID=A0A563DY71_9MICO|nr:ABC transporter substrate-binding protein [Leekyejoonella antrihumi]